MKELEQIRKKLSDRNMTQVYERIKNEKGLSSYAQLTRFMRGDNNPRYTLVKALEEYLNENQ